jgi:serine/threonine protein kinase
MAPETIRGKIISEKTDIFNFGATLYRMATLKLPPSCAVSAETVRINEKAWKAMYVPVQDLNKNVPEELCDLIHRCMAFNADHRPERMSVVYEELKQIADNLGEVVEGGTDPEI